MSPHNSSPGSTTSDSNVLLPSPTPIMSATIYQPNPKVNLPCNNPGPSTTTPTPKPSTVDKKATEKQPANLKDAPKSLKKVKKAEKIAGQRRVSKPSSAKPSVLVATVDESVCEKIREASKRRLSSDSENSSKQPSAKKSKRRFTRCQGQMKYMCGVCSIPDCGECSNCL